MGAAVLVALEICQNPSNAGRQYFAMGFQAPNYNDTYVYCSLPRQLHDMGMGKVVMATNVEIQHIGTIGVELSYIWLQCAGQAIAYMPHHTTTKAVDLVAYEPNAFIDMNKLEVDYPFFNLYLTGGIATDDLVITVRGYIESTPVGGEPSYVSLEGYKWPLVRR